MLPVVIFMASLKTSVRAIGEEQYPGAHQATPPRPPLNGSREEEPGKQPSHLNTRRRNCSKKGQ